MVVSAPNTEFLPSSNFRKGVVSLAMNQLPYRRHNIVTLVLPPPLDSQTVLIEYFCSIYFLEVATYDQKRPTKYADFLC